MDDHQVTRALGASAQDGRDLAAVTEALDGGRRHGRQAESLARPRRRRFRMMARPPRVLIRARKPCLRARRRLLGWKVRFDTTDASRGIGVDECTRRGADPAERRTTPPANRGSRGRATRTCTGATECAERTALFAPTATGGRGGGADGDPSRGRSTAHQAGAVPSRWPGTAQRSRRSGRTRRARGPVFGNSAPVDGRHDGCQVVAGTCTVTGRPSDDDDDLESGVGVVTGIRPLGVGSRPMDLPHRGPAPRESLVVRPFHTCGRSCGQGVVRSATLGIHAGTGAGGDVPPAQALGAGGTDPTVRSGGVSSASTLDLETLWTESLRGVLRTVASPVQRGWLLATHPWGSARTR
jgi:hypothetical protein